MSTTTVSVSELKTHLSAYLRRAEASEKILVTRRDTPVGRLVLPANGEIEPWHDACALEGPTENFRSLQTRSGRDDGLSGSTRNLRRILRRGRHSIRSRRQS